MMLIYIDYILKFLRKRRSLALWKSRNELRWIKDGEAFKIVKIEKESEAFTKTLIPSKINLSS